MYQERLEQICKLFDQTPTEKLKFQGAALYIDAEGYTFTMTCGQKTDHVEIEGGMLVGSGEDSGIFYGSVPTTNDVVHLSVTQAGNPAELDVADAFATPANYLHEGNPWPAPLLVETYRWNVARVRAAQTAEQARQHNDRQYALDDTLQKLNQK